MIKHPTKAIAIHSWDWKAQPDWDAITSVVNEFADEYSSHVFIKSVETFSDEYAIVIHAGHLSDEEVKESYHQYGDWEDGIDPEQLDWRKAQEHLNKIRLKYFKISTLGFDYTEKYINPLLLRISKGERTSDLFDSIMDLK